MLLIKNGYVKTMAGPDIPDGCVLIGDDGKIGEPYYLLRFNSSGRLEEIRIGVWWYEDEYEYTLD